jgi:acyl-CoA synthetase (AMP-forming)/AMP-acid ligase II
MKWNLADFGERSAVFLEDGTTVSYAKLKEETEKLASQITRRCLVLILCSNRLGSLIGYIAFLNHHVVPMMLDAELDKRLLAALTEAYRPEYIWHPVSMQDTFSAYEKQYDAWDYRLSRTDFAVDYTLADDLALLLTTSGSTGSPKFVRQSYKNIRSNTESIVEYLNLTETERAITTLPMQYTYGLSIINSHLAVGASIILTQKSLTQKEFWQQVKDYGATNFGGVPYTYEILKRLRFLRMDLPDLRYVTQAGGKLSADLCLEFAEGMRAKGKDFIVMYGATEATARMSYVPREMAVAKAGGIGIAIPGGRIELLDVNGKAVTETGVTGELVYYGDNVTLGYAESRADLSKPDEYRGRLETGDMAVRDEDGCYCIVGRKSRFLKIYGNRVNLMEVEELLKKQGYEAACVGEDDHMRVYTTDADTEGLHTFISRITGINRAAFEISRIAEIPRNDAGKTLYSELGRND